MRQLENVVRRAVVTRQEGEPLRLSDLPPELWLQIANANKGTPSPARSADGSPPVLGDPDEGAPAHGQDPRPFDAMSILAASSWKLTGALDLCEQQILSAALHASRGNRSRAARMLGISARSIFNKIRKHRLTA